MSRTTARTARGEAARTRDEGGARTRPRAQRRAPQKLVPLEALHASAGNRAVDALVRSGTASSGEPLAPVIRRDMEERFGHDFGSVRIHADPSAARSADLLHANAFTVGDDVVFGPERFAPDTLAGRRLLAHELAHVVQQSRGGPPPALDPDAPHEHAARDAADAVAASGGPVTVQGATGVGVAADVTGWLSKKYDATKEKAAGAYESARKTYHQAKEYIPEEIREGAATAAGFALDTATDVTLGPVVKQVPEFVHAAYVDAKEASTGVDDPEAKGVRELANEKVQRSIGRAKGVLEQATGLVDNVVWAGGELRDLKNDAVTATAGWVGVDPDSALTAMKVAETAAAPLFPSLLAVDSLGEVGDAMKEAGLVDEQGKASLTTPVLAGYDFLGDWAEEQIGAKPTDDDALFTQREIGELEGAVGAQVALAFVGVTEVKVALSAIGALAGVRGIVETMRAKPDSFYREPGFWSGLLTSALSIVGLKGGSGAGKKIITIAVNSGAVLQAVPPLWQLYNDYFTPGPELQADPETHRQVLVKDLNAVIRALVDVVVTIIKSGRAGKPVKPIGARGSAGDAESGVKPGGTTAATQGGTSGSIKSAGKLRRADARATKAENRAARQETTANEAEARAQRSVQRAKQSQTRADEQRGRAGKRRATASQREEEARGKADARAQARQQAEAARESGDAKAQQKLDAKAARAEKAADRADARAGRARTRADKSEARAQQADARAQRANARAARAQAEANQARSRADKSRARAEQVRARADALKPPVDPQSSFAGLDGPDTPTAPGAHGTPAPNAEPLVWVRTGTGKVRGTYVPEGDRRFGKGSGVALPQSEAEGVWNARPAGTAYEPKPITPRTSRTGRQLESREAGGAKGSRFISATAEDPRAVKVTSIAPDIAESRAYNHVVNRGEFGVLRPLGSNVPGVDSITARIDFDPQGRPVRAKIFLNDVTTPNQPKGPKASHAQWQGELARALKNANPADPAKSLFGDPRIDAALLKAMADGDVHVRVVRVGETATGGVDIRINPSETWRLGPTPVPRLPNVVAPPERDDDEEKEQP